MKKLVSRVIGCAIVLSIIATYFCACSLFGGKKDIKASIDAYWTSEVIANANSFSDDYSEQVLVKTILDSSSIDVQEITIEKDQAEAQVLLTTCNYAGYEGRIKLDDLTKALSEDSSNYEDEITFTLSKVDGTWIVTDDTKIAVNRYLNAILDKFEFYGIPEVLATNFVEMLIGGFQDGDYEVASSYKALKAVVESYDEEYQDSIINSYMLMFSSYFGTATDISYEVVGNYDDRVDVLVECSIVDTEASWEAFYEDEEAFLELIKENFRYFYGAEGYDIGTYTSIYADTVSECYSNSSERTTLQVVFPVTYDEAQNLQVYLDNMFVSDSGFFMSTNNEHYLNLRTAALDSLLEEGTITERQYNEALGVVYGSNYAGVDFSYTESDEIYSCSYSIVEDSMIRINLITWGYYDEGTTFRYEVFKDDELVSEDASYVISSNHSDEIYPEFVLGEEEDSELMGNYLFVVYNPDGTELISVSINIKDSDEIDTLIPEIPSTWDTGTSMTFEGDEANDIYYVHFENLINDQPSAFHAGDDGFDVYVCTWSDYNEGDCFVYAVYLNGELIGSERMAYVDGRVGLDRIELIYEGEGSDGLQVGDYTIVLYNNNSSDVLLVAYLTVS